MPVFSGNGTEKTRDASIPSYSLHALYCFHLYNTPTN